MSDFTGRCLCGAVTFSGTWGGDASAAAKEAVDGVRKDLDAHGQEALAVAQAAGDLRGDRVGLATAVDDDEVVAVDPMPSIHGFVELPTALLGAENQVVCPVDTVQRAGCGRD